jgi:hypothetical protein
VPAGYDEKDRFPWRTAPAVRPAQAIGPAER